LELVATLVLIIKNRDDCNDFCIKYNLFNFLELNKKIEEKNVEGIYNLLKTFCCIDNIIIFGIQDEDLKIKLIDKFKFEYDEDDKEFLLNILIDIKINILINKNDTDLVEEEIRYFIEKKDEFLTLNFCDNLIRFYFNNKAYTNTIKMIKYKLSDKNNFVLSDNVLLETYACLIVCYHYNKDYNELLNNINVFLCALKKVKIKYIYKKTESFVMLAIIYILYIFVDKNYEDKESIIKDNFELFEKIVGNKGYWLIFLLKNKQFEKFEKRIIEHFKIDKNIENIQLYGDIFLGDNYITKEKLYFNKIEYNSYFQIEGDNSIFFIGDIDKKIGDIIVKNNIKSILLNQKINFEINNFSSSDTINNVKRKITKIFTPFGYLNYLFHKKFKELSKYDDTGNFISIPYGNTEEEKLNSLKNYLGTRDEPYNEYIDNFYIKLPSFSLFCGCVKKINEGVRLIIGISLLMLLIL
jgi:hypothetical protein